MLGILRSVNNALNKVLDAVIVSAMAGMVVLIFAQVIWRYVLRHPLSWSEELSRYLFSVITLFGSAILFRESRHINMALLVDLIKDVRIKKLIGLFAQFCSLVFLGVMIYYSYPMSMMIIEFEVVSPSMEWLMMGWIFMMVPLASLLSAIMLLEVILYALGDVRKREEN